MNIQCHNFKFKTINPYRNKLISPIVLNFGVILINIFLLLFIVLTAIKKNPDAPNISPFVFGLSFPVAILTILITHILFIKHLMSYYLSDVNIDLTDSNVNIKLINKYRKYCINYYFSIDQIISYGYSSTITVLNESRSEHIKNYGVTIRTHDNEIVLKQLDYRLFKSKRLYISDPLIDINTLQQFTHILTSKIDQYNRNHPSCPIKEKVPLIWFYALRWLLVLILIILSVTFIVLLIITYLNFIGIQ